MTFRRLSALVLAVAFLAPAAALAQSTVTLDEGSHINAQLQGTLDSGNAYVGERFTATVVPPYPNNDATFANATIYGDVIKVVNAGQGRNPEIQLALQTITLSNGTSYPLNAQVTGAGSKQQMRNGGHVALTTIGGMFAGNIIGKTIFHTGIGGLLGALGGFMVGYNKKSNITLPYGTTLQCTLTRPLIVRRQPGHGYY